MTDEDLFNTDPEYSRQIKMSSSQYLLSTHRQVFFNPALDIIPNEALLIHLNTAWTAPTQQGTYNEQWTDYVTYRVNNIRM